MQSKSGLSLAKKLLAATVSSALIATPALARKASSLTDINGARGSSAETMLQQRGFKYITGNKNSMGYVYSYWWDGRDNDCVVVEVYNGRVETINDATAGDCNHSGGNGAAAAGAVLGLAILGAALASKSHHRQGQDYDERQTATFDRGYTDGLHNAPYHNYGRDEAYARGYEAGVDERNANLSHHHNRGGYSQVVEFKDLQGARAAGAMSELDRRGFTQVDNFTSGNARYSIQWRSSSRQCLQAIIADGRIEDIRDIGQHPKCR